MTILDKVTANPDIERWNRKYAGSTQDKPTDGNKTNQVDPQIKPQGEDELVALTQHLVSCFSKTPGTALEVASGKGRNALYLASLGYHTFAVDCALNGLAPGQTSANRLGLSMNSITCDLERYPFPNNHFNLVSVVRFLHRPLFPSIAKWVKPGGLLFYKTFNRNHLLTRPNFNPDYVVDPGELNSAFSEFDILASDCCCEGEIIEASGSSFILGRKKKVKKY